MLIFHIINVLSEGSKTSKSTVVGVWCQGLYRTNISIALWPTLAVFQTVIYRILAAAPILVQHLLGYLNGIVFRKFGPKRWLIKIFNKIDKKV